MVYINCPEGSKFKIGDTVRIIDKKLAKLIPPQIILKISKEAFLIDTGTKCVSISDERGLFGFNTIAVENLELVIQNEP